MYKSPLLCDRDQSCLLLIDIQAKLSAAIPDKVITRLRANNAILIEASNKLDLPVIATAQYPKGLGPIEPFITDRLSNTARTFEKTCFSCLGADGLPEHLTALNRKQVIITGIEAHICVFQTAAELQAVGHEVFVVNDAIASRTLSSYDTAVARLAAANIKLLSTESVLFEWLRDAKHPQFRELSKLIV